MRARVKISGLSVFAVTFVFCASSAWAGDGGGESLPAVQMVLNQTCAATGVTSCPQLPTINQVVIEIAALLGTSPNQARDASGVPAGNAIDAGTASSLANPLAFITAPDKSTPPVPTQPNDPAANSFISATTSPAPSPTTLNLMFDYLARTNPVFAEGQDVGDITLPFLEADANGNDLGAVSGVLHIIGTGSTTVATDVVADLLGTGTPQTYTLAQLGMTSAFSVGSTGLEFDLEAPLLITSDLAPAYSFTAPGFEFDPVDGIFEGIDPVATFLTANFVNDANDPLADHADLAVGTKGGTYLSDPTPTPEPTTTALLGGGLAGFGLLRWRRAADRRKNSTPPHRSSRREDWAPSS
jgi:hypothetical protein